MASSFKIQRRLRLLCRVMIIYSSSAVLLVFLVYCVYYSQLIGTLKISDKTEMATTFTTKDQNKACSDNMFLTLEGCLPCPNGTFSFSGWSECEPLLNCSNIAFHVHPINRIKGAFTKQIWLADWKGHQVIYVNCSRTKFKKRCLFGITRLEQLQGPYVTRLIGLCHDTVEVSYMILYNLLCKTRSVIGLELSSIRVRTGQNRRLKTGKYFHQT